MSNNIPASPAATPVESVAAEPCCMEWHTCMKRCVPLAENWRMDAKRLEREIADLRRLIDRGRSSNATELALSAQLDEQRNGNIKLMDVNETLRGQLAEAVEDIEQLGLDKYRFFEAKIELERKLATARQEERQMLIQLVGKLGGRGYTYQAMMGHMRDLPTSRGLKEST